MVHRIAYTEPHAPSHLKLVRIMLFGKAGHLRERRSYASSIAQSHLGELTATILPPSKPPTFGIGFVERGPRGEVLVDGAMLSTHRRACMVGQSRDCPYVVLENRRNGRVAFGHAGRWSLVHNIISNLIECVAPDRQTTRVRAFITGGISPRHFLHGDAPELVAPLVARHGESIFHCASALSLDLGRVIRLELQACGVAESHIREDGHCTFTHPKLGSKRAEDAGHIEKDRMNWVMIQRL